jgi:hypothetical protein
LIKGRFAFSLATKIRSNSKPDNSRVLIGEQQAKNTTQPFLIANPSPVVRPIKFRRDPARCYRVWCDRPTPRRFVSPVAEPFYNVVGIKLLSRP